MRFLLRDVLYGIRLLRRSPAFTSLAAAIIALGIGAATAIFSLIYGVVLNALPFHDADRLMAIWADFSKSGGNRRAYIAPADYFDWKERSRSFTGMTAYRNTNRTFTALDQPVTPLAQEVPADYFDVLGVQAMRGRTFVAGEDRSGPDSVAVISYRLWKSLFNGSEDAIGKSVELDGRAVQLVGVLPPGFRMPNNSIVTPPDLWIAASFDGQRLERVQRSLVAFGRLKPGISPAQAEAEMASISEQIAREHSQIAAAPRAWARPIREDMTGEFRGAFLLLLGAVGIMLLIACANVANLLLARTAGRAREVALRTALGASRAAVVRQMLTESALLALIGGAGGVLVAQFSIGPLLALIPAAAGLPFAENVQINLPVLAFAMVLSLLTALFFGLAPARQALGASLVESLKEGGRSRSGGREGARWRNALIVLEVGLSIVLLTGAGLMIQTFWRLSNLNPGYDATRVLNVRNSLRGETYATAEARRNHFATAAAKLAAIPGVESVSAVSFPPPIDPFAPAHFTLAGEASDAGRDYTASPLVILPRYFETLRNPILSGRGITEADTADSPRVAVVTRELAHRYFANRDPVGRSIRLSGALGRGVAHRGGCGGHCRQRQPSGAAAGGVRSARAGSGRHDEFPSAHACRAGHPGPDRRAYLVEHGPSDERLSHHDSGAGGRRGPLAEPLHDDFADAVCGAGADTGHRGNLRRDFVPDAAANARDRHPHGVRGAARRRAAHGDRTRSGDGGGGGGVRNCRVARGRPVARLATVRSRRHRPAHAGRGLGAGASGRGRGVRRACDARRVGGARGRIAQGLAASQCRCARRGATGFRAWRGKRSWALLSVSRVIRSPPFSQGTIVRRHAAHPRNKARPI